MKTIKLALIGYGNVGKAFVKMLKRRRTFFEDAYDCQVKITLLCTKSRGVLRHTEGLSPGALVSCDLANMGFRQDTTVLEQIDTMDYDVLVELTPVNIMTGQPAIDHIRHALQRGKHVITANKGPVAWAYRELRKLAAEHNAHFFHEAAVMDGAPVFNLTRHTLRGCRILEVKGILNATTNYVLYQLERGVSVEDAIREGQRRGFVEADPSLDLEGWDAAAKLTALMNVLMDVKITPMQVVRRGISGLTRADLELAKARRQRIKLLCRGWVEGSSPVGIVEPQAIPEDSLLASINGTAAAVTLTTDLMGDISIVEHVYVPEIDQTAYGVLGDLFRILEQTRS